MHNYRILNVDPRCSEAEFLWADDREYWDSRQAAELALSNADRDVTLPRGCWVVVLER